MSRSIKHYPGMGHCGGSEKQDKRRWHRTYRRVNRQRLHTGAEPLPIREVVNIYLMSKDGKARFNPATYPKGMRK